EQDLYDISRHDAEECEDERDDAPGEESNRYEPANDVACHCPVEALLRYPGLSDANAIPGIPQDTIVSLDVRCRRLGLRPVHKRKPGGVIDENLIRLKIQGFPPALRERGPGFLQKAFERSISVARRSSDGAFAIKEHRQEIGIGKRRAASPYADLVVGREET